MRVGSYGVPMETEPALYFNPSCSKCRTADALLKDHGIEAVLVRYLDRSPTTDELSRLMSLLGIDDPRAMMRTSEPVYDELRLSDASNEQLLEAINQHPILLERPIFVMGDRALMARPPERLLELL
jgi:arsenate reductase (glutaredoxin)